MSYEQRIYENDKLIRHDDDLVDPFVNTTIRPKGFRQAWRVLIGRYELRYHIDADRETISRVMLLNPDYLGPENRDEWNAQLDASLKSFATSLNWSDNTSIILDN